MAKMDYYSVREKYYSDIPMTEFERVVSFDPTRKDGKMGLYSKYLLSLYRKGVEIPDDTTDVLCRFDSLKPYLKKKDIGAYKNFEEIKVELNSFKTIPVGKQAAMKAAKRNGAEMVIDNEYCRTYRLLTAEAARIYGENTKWCTVKADEYERYAKEGHLFVIIPNDNPREKLQLYIQSARSAKGGRKWFIMTAEDAPVAEIPRPLEGTMECLFVYALFVDAGDKRFDGASYHMDGKYPGIPLNEMKMSGINDGFLIPFRYFVIMDMRCGRPFIYDFHNRMFVLTDDKRIMYCDHYRRRLYGNGDIFLYEDRETHEWRFLNLNEPDRIYPPIPAEYEIMDESLERAYFVMVRRRKDGKYNFIWLANPYGLLFGEWIEERPKVQSVKATLYNGDTDYIDGKMQAFILRSKYGINILLYDGIMLFQTWRNDVDEESLKCGHLENLDRSKRWLLHVDGDKEDKPIRILEETNCWRCGYPILK